MAMLYNYENLTSADIDFFESLPISQRIAFDGMEPVLVCHGTPFANNKELHPNSEDFKDILHKCQETISYAVTHIFRESFITVKRR